MSLEPDKGRWYWIEINDDIVGTGRGPFVNICGRSNLAGRHALSHHPLGPIMVTEQTTSQKFLVGDFVEQKTLTFRRLRLFS